VYRSNGRLQIVLFVFMVLVYGATLSDIGLGPAADPYRATFGGRLQHLTQQRFELDPAILRGKSFRNLTFNSMVQHLAHGQFDVDPAIVGNEGFLRDGHVYAYWGIWCALLRIPLLLAHRLNVDITTWSCLAAVCLAGMMKVRTVLLVRGECRRQGAVTAASEPAFGLMLAYVLLGGSAVGYLQSLLWQEVVFWAAAFGAIFVYFAVKGIVERQFTTGTLCWMALAAGLALITRVSTGVGLCVALALLLLVLRAGAARRAVAVRRILLPVGILIAFLVIAGTVNYYRWGSATTFADYRFYIGNRFYPDRWPRVLRYGYFNPVRIPLGLSYYFLPLWAFHAPGGQLFFEGAQTRLVDALELPPGSFLLTDLLPIAFLCLLARAMGSRSARRLLPLGRSLALAAGLAVPCVLMLMAISMNYRYRMEFYPEIDLLAFLGLYVTVVEGEALARFVRWRRWMTFAAAVNVVAAFTMMILYKLSDLGPSQQLLRNGVVNFYLSGIRP
jgi:hypothetical protein